MPRGPKATRLGDTTEQVAGPIRALIADLERRIQVAEAEGTEVPHLYAQLWEQRRQLAYVENLPG